MSFVAGLATGKVLQKKRLLVRLRDYIQRQGITIADRDGQPVAIEALIDDAFGWHMSSTWRLLGGASLLALLVVGLLLFLF